mgnify:CR=1 FL=1
MEYKLIGIIFFIACCVLLFMYKEKILEATKNINKDTLITNISSTILVIGGIGIVVYYLYTNNMDNYLFRKMTL